MSSVTDRECVDGPADALALEEAPLYGRPEMDPAVQPGEGRGGDVVPPKTFSLRRWRQLVSAVSRSVLRSRAACWARYRRSGRLVVRAAPHGSGRPLRRGTGWALASRLMNNAHEHSVARNRAPPRPSGPNPARVCGSGAGILPAIDGGGLPLRSGRHRGHPPGPARLAIRTPRAASLGQIDDHGSDSRGGPGADSGAGPGADSGAGPGADSGAGPGSDSGAGPAAGPVAATPAAAGMVRLAL